MQDGLVEVNDYAYLNKYEILSNKYRYSSKSDKFEIINPDKISLSEKIKFRFNFYPTSFCNKKEGYLEINNSWYTKHFLTKFFKSYDKFMNTFFVNYKPKNYIRFSPGCNYIIPSKNIYNYKKDLYVKLRALVDYAPVIGEAHILERALYTIFQGKLIPRK